MKKYKLIITILSFLMTSSIYSQRVASTDTTSNSAIFLNAASDSKPREVSLGLPTNSSSAVPIFEDGLPVSYYIYHLFPYKSWHGGVSASRTSTIGPMETAMRYGEINNFVDSYNRTGSDSFSARLNYTIGIYGQNKFDINIAGPIARNLQYSLSTYQNFDPGSVRPEYPKLIDRHQFYKGAISSSFAQSRGHMALVYQYVNFMSVQENFGPFIFVGDGSVKSYNGFNLGRDSYRPPYEEVSFMDFMTGITTTMDLKKGNTDSSHHLTFNLNYDFTNGSRLIFRSRMKIGDSIRGAGTLAGIDQAEYNSGYTTADGNVYTGPVQKRNLMHFDTFESSWMNNAEYHWTNNANAFTLGLDFHINHGGTVSSSAMFAHEVSPDPQGLRFNDARYFNFNTAAEYYDGHERKYAVYFADEITSRRLNASFFTRFEGLSIYGKSANNIGDDRSNTRYSGFNLTKGKITSFDADFLNGAAGAKVIFNIFGGLSTLADFTFTRVHANIFNYGGFYDPSTDPTDTYFTRFGFSFRNEIVNVVSQLNYITQSNYNTRSIFPHKLVKDTAGNPAGHTESVTLPLTYGISSLGWTTDAMITPCRGLNVHMQFTMRNPKYRDFVFSPTFSDGVTEVHDFSDKNVTNLHKVELVIDPSYSINNFRFWLSTRYISRQYINKTNSLYFKGRLETFGGIDYKIKDILKFSLNVINLLNQKGASGVISSADLVEDASGYKNYLMSGTFIRPFTVELGFSLDL
ncbi:MAG: hypothetical protein MJZ15_02500 [Bacteroidales bacterium]|nr:hypothetical protein [Bacteroidales bacterium]